MSSCRVSQRKEAIVTSVSLAPLADIFPGDSDLSRLMRAHDWGATKLGPPERWPEGLKVPLRMMLASRFEMWLGWGPDLAFFYNDAYVPTLGLKHPMALGRPMREVWREIYATIEDRILAVTRDGVATWDKALLLLLERSGYPEETYHTFSYSPLRDDRGAIEGLMCVVSEETERVINQRRLDTLGGLADVLLDTKTRDEVLARVRVTLAANRWDIPFSLIFLREPDGHWTGHAGSEDADDLVGAGWLHEVVNQHAGGAARIPLDDVAEPVPAGCWPAPPREALLVPIARSSGEAPFGVLVVGLNRYRPDDPDIVGFAQLIAGQIAGALANVEALRSERRRADRIWLNSRDLIGVVGLDGVFRSASPSWGRILGYPPEEVVGRSFLEFIHPDDAALSQIALEDAARNGEATSFENRYVCKSGDIRWISWQSTIEGELIYAYGRDITERKLQADALRASEQALRQSQKMEAVGQLTGGLAHDFNNLLAGISGSLELLQLRIGQGRTANLGAYIEAAQGAAKRAAALTHRLLAFSRQQTLDPKPTDINRLVAGMEELLRRTVGPQITMEVVAAGGLWNTLVDQNQLENALLNLCINARDAMPDGGRLTIETGNRWFDQRTAQERELAPGQYLSLCVSDTGHGMTPEVIRRAFDPFFTTKPIGMGTGLGLSMIHGFARQSGGQARIYSEVGQGSMVCLYLPRHFGEADMACDSGHAMSPPRASDGATVLVIDDEPTVRMLVSEVLEELGYQVLEAGNGAAGLAILRSRTRIDLLVTDVGLPGGLNGRQVADAARTTRPDLRVLFITGYAENAVVGNGYLEPGMQVLTKPFSTREFGLRVGELVGERT